MHMQHDLDSAIDSAEQPASTGLQNSRSNFLADILNEGDDAPGSPLSAGPSTKRAKRDDGRSNSTNGRRGSGQHLDASTSSAGNAAVDEVEEIEQIDLIDDDTPLATALQKQRAEQVKAQQESQTGADAPPRLTSLTCVICMDTPKDLTATACGHVFCHACLMEALIAGEARAGPGEPKRSQCPVCRKTLSRNKTGDIIPLLLMKKGLATQPRRQKAANTAAATA
ncbi:zinc finger ring-type protein [Neofusicoccum parvum]|uniref:Zinc finger ring-type protein n=1 Tax=Neofusicoccum parvum TaxID=310453 RepID=A0ACB5S0R3_9PEZI|nr:zinc finger ring-type protein [Neofusicoccum parvum]